MVQRLPITQARINLGALVKRVHLNKEYVILEKDGIPIAGVMDIDEFEDYLELRDTKVREHIRKSNEEYLAGKSRPYKQFLAELRKEEQGKVKRRQKVWRRLTRRSDIKKLEAVPEGEGQWRLALGRFRFRYDIANQEIVLHYCGLRREGTYRDWPERDFLDAGTRR